MKKRIVYTLIGLSIVLLIAYLLRYKQSLNFDNKIPSTATQVLNVDLRKIEHHVLMDFLKNPFTYISFKSSKKEKDSLSLIDAVSIPKNVLFYTNETNFKDAWFSSALKVKNNAELNAYLVREGFKKGKHEGLVLFSKGYFTFAVKDKKLLFAVKKTKRPFNTVIENVFKETDFLTEESELLKTMIASKSAINYAASNNDFLKVNFKNGMLEVSGKLESDLFIADNHEEFSENSVGYIAAKFNKKHNPFKLFITDRNNTKFNELTKLSIDSIASKWNGNITLNLKSIKSKTDTIVTYEYDNDFNKVEKKSVQEVTIPDLNIGLGTQSNLTEYLSSKNAVQVVENDTLFTSIPLCKFYAKTSASSFEISTEKLLSKPFVKENNSKLNAYFNVEKYLENPLEFSFLPTNNEYVQLLKDASINYSNENQISVKVHLKNTKRNFIGQLAKH